MASENTNSLLEKEEWILKNVDCSFCFHFGIVENGFVHFKVMDVAPQDIDFLIDHSK